MGNASRANRTAAGRSVVRTGAAARAGADGSCECDEGYSWSPNEAECWPDCPENADNDPEDGACECDDGYGWNPGQTACWPLCVEGAHNDPGTGACECNEGLEWSPDGTACWPVCPANSSYSPEADACLCDEGTVVALDGETCLLECPPGSHAEGGFCVCDAGTDFNPETGTCEEPPQVCGLGGAEYPVPAAFSEGRFGKSIITENLYPVIKDKLTGLMWQGCDAGLTGFTCTEGFLSLKKPASAASYCESSTWAGFDDWRLPTIVDWMALVDNGLSEQYGSGSFFWYYDKIKTNDTWWSSTKPEYAVCPQECYLGLMKDDPAILGYQWYIQYAFASFGRRVRCVRDPSPPLDHCAQVLGGTERVLYLEAANRLWQGCPAGLTGSECQTGTVSKMAQAEAVQYCDELVWGGFDDWTLPDLNHFLTIVDFNVQDEPLADVALLPGMTDLTKTYWSALAGSEDGEGWTFDYGAGQAVSTGVELGWAVRCTRVCPGNFAGPECLDCAPGWEGDGCDVVVGCVSNPCFPGVSCKDIFGVGFECGAFPEGFEGNGIECSDIDGCAEAPCYDGVECFDVPAPGLGFTCGACPLDMYGDGIDCVPVIPCETVEDCGSHADCEEVDAAVFSCVCDPGYDWDGQACLGKPMGFSTASSFPTTAWPWDVLSADFNGDGEVDLVVTTMLADKVHVFLGDGIGGAVQSYEASTGDKPRGVAVGDFNLDTKTDLAIARETDDDVRLFYGDGAGGFAGGVLLPTQQSPRSIGSADVNGDTFPDLVVGHDFAFGLTVLLATGDGGFADGFSVDTGGHDHWEVDFADFDGDGAVDLVVPDSTQDFVKVLFGDGGGNFGGMVTLDLGAKPFGVAAGDVNGDDHPDVVAGIIETGHVGVLLGDGAGGFGPVTKLTSGAATRDVALGDFDLDGHVDIASSNFDADTVTVFYGAGDGTFPTKVTLTDGGDAPLDGPGMLDVVDFNGNGYLDLVVTSQMNNRLVVLHN